MRKKCTQKIYTSKPPSKVTSSFLSQLLKKLINNFYLEAPKLWGSITLDCSLINYNSS